MEASGKPGLSNEQAARKARMAVLAQADGAELKQLWDGLDLDPECRVLRGPETGLLTLRGRIGGGGSPFNVGEATVTRTTVKLGNGAIGHSIMLGRDKTKAKLAAIIDALAADKATGRQIEEAIIAPLERSLTRADAIRRSETAATKVEFFTMVRGED